MNFYLFEDKPVYGQEICEHLKPLLIMVGVDQALLDEKFGDLCVRKPDRYPLYPEGQIPEDIQKEIEIALQADKQMCDLSNEQFAAIWRVRDYYPKMAALWFEDPDEDLEEENLFAKQGDPVLTQFIVAKFDEQVMTYDRFTNLIFYLRFVDPAVLTQVLGVEGLKGWREYALEYLAQIECDLDFDYLLSFAVKLEWAEVGMHALSHRCMTEQLKANQSSVGQDFRSIADRLLRISVLYPTHKTREVAASSIEEKLKPWLGLRWLNSLESAESVEKLNDALGKKVVGYEKISLAYLALIYLRCSEADGD